MRRGHRARTSLPLLLAAGLLIGAGTLAAERPLLGDVPAGTLLSADLLSSWTPADIQREAVGFFEYYPVPAMLQGAESWLLRFSTRDFDGTAVAATAQLFVPTGLEGAEAPVLVFGSGTTGLADACAPSGEQPLVHRLGWYAANMLSYAGQGIIAMIPDYIGFGDARRPQRYFSAAAEAHVLLDAARALRAFFGAADRGVVPSPRVVTAGFSQGGHAAFSAADMRGAYAPEVDIAGVIGFGATCDVERLLREGPVYAPFLLYSWQQMYGTPDVDPARILQEPWAATLAADAARMCVDEFQRYYPTDATLLYRTDFHQALNNGRLSTWAPRLAARLAENRAGLSGHGLPALVVQGDADSVITTASQDAYVAALRAAGSDVTYVVLPAVRHRYVRQAAFTASVEWIRALVAAAAP